MTDRRKRWAVAGLFAILGGAFLFVALYDVYEDVLIQGDPILFVLFENTLPVLINVGVIWYGVRILRQQPSGDYLDRVFRWVAATVVSILGITSWMFLFQLQQSRMKPLILTTNLVAVSALIGLVIGVQDAERERRERQLERERNRFASLFENVPNPIAGVRFEDDDPVVETVNPAFEDVFGYREVEIMDESLDEYVLPSGSDLPAVEPDGGSSEEEVRLETKQGRRDFLRMTAPVTGRSPGEACYAIFIDITDRNQRQERLRVLSRMLRHDIRNKMTVVEGNARMLRDELADPELEELADGIQTAATDLLSMSEQSRRISDTVAGTSEHRSVDLTEVAERAVQRVAQRSDATFDVDLPEETTVLGTGALTEAVENVVENAVEHNDNDVPHVEVTYRETHDGEYVDLLVADDGPGMPDAEEEVVTGDRSPDQLDHTSGLGLWFVVWVLTNLGGQLTFEQNDPRGTVAVLRLPKA